MSEPQRIETTCCIAGGGPAGMVLGFLLARAGVAVTVLEKHGDFLRDFRGDTVHPSTLDVMAELGLLDAFLERPHQEARRLSARIGDTTVQVADFTHLPTRCKFVAFMPQWDFLDFLASEGKSFAAFDLRMRTTAVDLLERDGAVVGLHAQGPEGALDIHADMVVACDGRHSILRERAGLRVVESGAPIDVLWMRLPRRADDPDQPLGRADAGQFFVMLDRGDYFQCALVIPKGGFDAVKAGGLPALRARIERVTGFDPARVATLSSWDDIKLLSVTVDHLQRWYRPGLLFIGDAAHAMSPIGGVGINFAVQDAVAAANLLAAALRARRVTRADLARVQRRRAFPARLTQRVQVLIQNRILAPMLARQTRLRVPFVLRCLQWWPVLQRIPARLIGIGIRPEHVRTAERPPA